MIWPNLLLLLSTVIMRILTGKSAFYLASDSAPKELGSQSEAICCSEGGIRFMSRVIVHNAECIKSFGMPRTQAAYNSMLSKLSEEARSERRKWSMSILRVGLALMLPMSSSTCAIIALPTELDGQSMPVLCHFSLISDWCMKQAGKYLQSWLDLHELLRPVFTDVPDGPCLARIDSKVCPTPSNNAFICI